jgi:phosphatidylserine/phosphatidylglycerophosphate/cardiolipin synthase-like enzyme
MIVNYIDSARKSIYVQAYNFTSPVIAQALTRAHQRGVIVEVILDRSVPTERNGQLSTLLKAGIPSMVDSSHAIAHNKVMVIDLVVVLSGSFNFTVSAEERNAENMVAITDVTLASSYVDNWNFHKLHAKPQ